MTPQNLLFCLIGALLGTLVGVLPGLGPVATIAMLLPITFTLPPVAALIMLAGLYYGAQYGGSTTAILVNIPGESSSVVTCIDGHMMARKGRAGSALAIAALGSFFAGCVATAVVALFSGPLVVVASSFRSPDYFGLLVFGLVAAVVLAQGSVVRSVAMVVLGLFLGLIGTDIASGQTRFTFGISALADGVGFVPVAMGLFGIAEVIASLERGGAKPKVIEKISRLWPTREEARQAWPAVLRGTGDRLTSGRAAGRRRADQRIRRLRGREEDRQGPLALRPGRHRGRGGTGIRQQCGRADLVHSAARHGHSAQPGDGADAGRHDHPRHRAGPQGDDGAARPVLGHDRLDVDRQPDADRHQPAADRHLGEVPADPLSLALFRHPRVLLHRRVHGQQHHRPTCW